MIAQQTNLTPALSQLMKWASLNVLHKSWVFSASFILRAIPVTQPDYVHDQYKINNMDIHILVQNCAIYSWQHKRLRLKPKSSSFWDAASNYTKRNRFPGGHLVPLGACWQVRNALYRNKSRPERHKSPCPLRRRTKLTTTVNTHFCLVFVGISVTSHEEVVWQVSLLYRTAGPLLDRAREVVLVLHETLRPEKLDPLVVPVGRSTTHLSWSRSNIVIIWSRCVRL